MKPIAALFALSWLILASHVHAVLYSVTDLGTLGGTNSQAYGINNSGTIVGQADTGGGATDAFSYSGGVMTDLSLPAGAFAASGLGINSSGLIVGGGSTFAGGTGFLYSGGTMITAPGGLSGAQGINTSGVIAGRVPAGFPHINAAIFDGTTTTNLGTLGGLNSQAYGINDLNQVIGVSIISGAQQHAFSWTSSGGMIDLGTLGGTNSVAFGINNSGIIIGQADTASATHAFTDSGGVMTDLGTLGGTFSEANGINTVGTIVGDSLNGGGTSLAFIDSGGVMTDLNTLLDASGAGWVLQSANALNDSGQIVGQGTIGGQTHAFLLNVVPEPSACALLVGGFGLLGAVVRRRHV